MNTQTARAKAERGISSAEAHAGKEWQDQAVAAARLFVRWNERVWNGTEFSMEMLRLWCEDRIDLPPDRRAWGGVTRRLKAEKIIKPTGRTLRAASSNLCPKPSYVRF